MNDLQITEPQHHGSGDSRTGEPPAELSDFEAMAMDEMPFHIPRD